MVIHIAFSPQNIGTYLPIYVAAIIIQTADANDAYTIIRYTSEILLENPTT